MAEEETLLEGDRRGETIENVSYHSTRRVDVSVGADYAADIDIYSMWARLIASGRE